MKKDIGFRFSEEAHARLGELAKVWGCTRTQVLEDLILHSEAPLHYRTEREKNGATSRTLDLTKTAQPQVLPKDPKEVAKVVGKAKTAPIFKKDPLQGVKTIQAEKDTRTQQEKLDDFYRSNMAKGKK